MPTAHLQSYSGVLVILPKYAHERQRFWRIKAQNCFVQIPSVQKQLIVNFYHRLITDIQITAELPLKAIIVVIVQSRYKINCTYDKIST